MNFAHRCLATLGAAASLSGSASAWAATSPAQVQYEKQKADCMSGKSNEGQATCLKEAGAALEQAKRGNLNDADADFRKNEMDRCKPLTGSERSDCMARMKGSGTVSGSVAGGGILREKKTTITGAPVSPGSVTVAPQTTPPLPPPVTASGPK